MKWCAATVCLVLVALLGLPLAAGAAEAGDSAQSAADAAAQANNPLANMTALNFQNYYIGRVTETGEDANQFWVRFAQPFSVAKTNWIMRASLPVNTYPNLMDGGHETGLGISTSSPLI